MRDCSIIYLSFFFIKQINTYFFCLFVLLLIFTISCSPKRLSVLSLSAAAEPVFPFRYTNDLIFLILNFFCLFNLKKIDDKLIINEKCLGFQSLLCLVVFFLECLWNVFFLLCWGSHGRNVSLHTKKITNLTYCNDA